MRELRFAKRFERDIRNLRRLRPLTRGDLLDLEHVFELFMAGEPLPTGFREHWLSESYAGYLECHLDADLLLIYKVYEGAVVLHRIGTHRHLFQARRNR